MDTGLGKFAPISKKKAEEILGKFAPISKKKAEEIFKRPFQTNDSNTLGIFCAGEELIIRGSKFRIVSVGRTKMKLRILKS